MTKEGNGATGYAIRLDNVTTGYSKGKRKKEICSALTAEFRSGRLTCLIGRNGTGKSTLLRTMAGFQPPLAGSITIAGRSVGSCSAGELAQTVAVVLTHQPSAGALTAGEVVALGRSPYTGFWGTLSDNDKRIVGNAMQLTGTADMAARPISELSDGERQRIMIAKALAQQTPVMLLDEPTAFLDYPGRRDLMSLMTRLACELGKCIVMSTHDLELAVRMADDIFELAPDGIRPVTPTQIKAEYGL